MNKKRILICDDDAGEREKLNRFLNKYYEIFESDNYEYLLDKVKELDPIHLVILDLGFKGEWVGHTILPALYERFPKLKVIIYSSLLDGKGTTEELSEILRQVNNNQVVGYASPRDTETRIVIEVNKVTGTSEWIKNNQVWFLHISDPQFGGDGLAYDSEKLSNKIWDCLKAYSRGKESLPPEDINYFDYPEFAVITGDIAERARPDDYNEASDFINKLSRLITNENPLSTGLLENNVIILPGNHDINWDISFARSIFNEPVKPEKRDENGKIITKLNINKNSFNDLEYLHQYSWHPYEKFATSFEKEPWHFDPGYKIIDLSKELHLILVCINSSRWHVHHISQKPEIPQKVFNKIRSELRDKYASENKATKILLVHHTLDADATDENQLKIAETTERNELINTLSQECEFSLVLTGHIHKRAVSLIHTGNNKRSLNHIGAGTLKSNDTAKYDHPQFNLIRLYDLSPELNKFRKAAVFTFAYNGTHYRIEKASGDGTEEIDLIDIKYV
ncbi:MAG: metallophosphoesterase [Acidobacteriota bacterium]|nr:metallophosphoesterase [Acidobacteriota bacterium]